MYWVDRSTGEIVSERDKNKPLLLRLRVVVMMSQCVNLLESQLIVTIWSVMNVHYLVIKVVRN